MRLVYAVCKNCKGTGEFLGCECKICRGQGQIAVKVEADKKDDNDMKTFCEVMHVDTRLFSKELEKLPEDERKIVIEDARQSAKKQQERLNKVRIWN